MPSTLYFQKNHYAFSPTYYIWTVVYSMCRKEAILSQLSEVVNLIEIYSLVVVPPNHLIHPSVDLWLN